MAQQYPDAVAYNIVPKQEEDARPEYRPQAVTYVNPHTGQTYVKVPPKGPTRLKGYKHLFDAHAEWKWFFPNVYRKPAYGYEKLGHFRHRDILQREWVGDNDDRYLSPFDGKVSKLVVQAVDDIYDNHHNATWRRTFIRNISPLYLRLANWPLDHVDYARNGGPKSEDWPLIVAKWFVASIAIGFVVGSPWAHATGKVRNGGKYDVFPYQYFGYPKVSRNLLENETHQGYRLHETNPEVKQLLRPRYLCFLAEEGQPAMITNVEAWIQQRGTDKDLSYIFIAYTAEQFPETPMGEHLLALHQIADAAARHTGVMAYWIGCSCMPEPEHKEEDVYRISDVIRGARSLAIAVGRPPNDSQGITTTDLMLQQWGRRIWTFPEVLLSPEKTAIAVYTRGHNPLSPEYIAKNQFAARVWLQDAHTSKQLIDHYEGNLILSQLPLVTLALECLYRRETGKWFPGDHSYALMGLLRVRPKVDPTDSDFQAFARLSLANDSDQLLERLFCIMPTNPDQPWYSMDDAYGCKLWDIHPQMVHVAGVGHDDTILLDGCRAANVRWKSFAPVRYNRIASWKRWVAQKMLHSSGYVFLIAVILLGTGAAQQRVYRYYGVSDAATTTSIYILIGVPFLVYSISLIMLSPLLLRILYLGKFWGTQPWFFGFEGYMDIETIERQIFGARLNRMTWSVNATPLSRHHKNEHEECVGDDPTTDPAIQAMVENAKQAGPGQQRIFTIVDTATMTVSLISAARPPVCFVAVAAEGGMQRAIGCSYDWTTSTLYRETVMRLPTPCLDAMSRVNRIKIGFKRPYQRILPMQMAGEAAGHRVV